MEEEEGVAATTGGQDKLAAHVEELRLPEIMLPAVVKRRGRCGKS